MFNDGVINLFHDLSPSFRTNSPRFFGKKIIVTRMADVEKAFRWSRLRFERAAMLDDLLRVFCVLDGKPEPDHRRSAAAQLRDKHWPGEAPDHLVDVDGYFSVKGFANGNAHINFHRPDLVDKLNKIVASRYPNALPAHR